MTKIRNQSTSHATCQPIAYGGWPNCVRLSDGRTELIITTDVGPRIIRYSFAGGNNLLKEFAGQMGTRGGKNWRSYGGHRLWIAPEDIKRTYVPDNEPVKWSWHSSSFIVQQRADPLTRLAKEIRIRYEPDGKVRILHRITNDGRRIAEFAPWALTVMAPGGEAVFPMEPFVPHPQALLPARPLVLWSYTKMNDPRWTWGEKEIRLRQDVKRREPQKAGFLNRQGWMAYVLKRDIFIKHHDYIPGATYPDMGCNVETFTNSEMLELETLAPLVRLEPGSHVDHIETWSLHRAARTGRTDLSALAGRSTV